jgi:nucleoside-diphosphate-sugar epimerase
MKILLVGANGFLGSELFTILKNLGHQVIRGVSKVRGPEDLEIPLFGKIDFPSIEVPDLLIDVSNKYFADESQKSIKIMEDTIIGIASTLCNSNKIWKKDFLQTTSYFQHCPVNYQPWNGYAEIRNKSLSMLKESASINNTNLYEFVLHDTYGNTRRNKFLDLCIEATQGKKLSAGDGYSVLNLTHIKDISDFISLKINQSELAKSDKKRWIIKSDDTYSLRELTKLVENVSGKTNLVNWNKLTQNRRQVIDLWDIPESNCEFQNKTKLPDWLSNYFSLESPQQTDLR